MVSLKKKLPEEQPTVDLPAKVSIVYYLAQWRSSVSMCMCREFWNKEIIVNTFPIITIIRKLALQSSLFSVNEIISKR